MAINVKKCVGCGTAYNDTSYKYCPKCGSELENCCSQCGYRIGSGAYKFCPKCGKMLRGLGSRDPYKTIKQARAGVARDRLTELRGDDADPYERMMNIKASQVKMRHQKPVHINLPAQKSVNRPTQQGVLCSTRESPDTLTRERAHGVGVSKHQEDCMKKENSEVGKNLAEAFVAVVGLVVSCIIAGEASEQEKYFVYFGAWLVATALSTLFGVEKRRGLFGFVLGLLLSWIGVLVIACFTTRDGAGRDE